MAVLIALVAAMTYGLSDFIGGVASRRTSAWPVAAVSAATALLASVAVALVLPGDPTTADLTWGALGGIGNGAGAGFLYRGLASGRMGVVGPVSAVGAAALPVVVGVLSGERPAALVWAGIVVAAPAIWLVAREPRPEPPPDGLVPGEVPGRSPERSQERSRERSPERASPPGCSTAYSPGPASGCSSWRSVRSSRERASGRWLSGRPSASRP